MVVSWRQAVLLAVAGGSSLTSASGSATAEQIADILVGTGIIPASIGPQAGELVEGILQASQASIDQDTAGCSSLRCTNPELYYSYGNSPPVYPSPQSAGNGLWKDAYTSARALVARMTDAEKNIVVTPAENFNGCSGYSGNVSRLGYTGLCLNDNGNSVHLQNTSITGFPSGISVGASWNRNLAGRRGAALGDEFKANGINMALGPVVGPLGRMAKGGRNWEGFANDPYLAGALVDPTIRGMQQSIIACVKHFIAYEQETNRQPFLNGLLQPLGVNVNNSVSSNVEDRAMHELYLWPFADAVRAGAGSVMSAYNRVNNSYSSQNSKILNGLLKTELGFEGFVVSDFYGQQTGVASANAGLDLVMPDVTYWGNNTLVKAKNNGSLETGRLDDMATRILATWYRFGKLSNPGVAFNKGVNARTSNSHATAYQSAVEGHVLLKNSHNVLPLHKPAALSIFGWDAISGDNTSASSPILYPNGLANTQTYTDGTTFGLVQFLEFVSEISAPGTSIPQIALNGTIIAGGGSGAVNPPLMISPFDALSQQAARDKTKLYTDFVSNNPKVEDPSSPCLVFINQQSSEAVDRLELQNDYSDALVKNVACQCANTIVVIHNMGIRTVDAWINHPNVTALIFAHAPGENSGNALTDILYGRQSPSGRLPYTVACSPNDYAPLLNPDYPTVENPQYSQSDFSEGVYIDYRHFEKYGIKPRYAFGYGLTYSTFKYSSIRMTRSNSNTGLSPPDANDATPPEGGLHSLWDTLVTVTAVITNTGATTAMEVAQLYVTIPNSGVTKQLRGFQKPSIRPGASTTVSFPLRRRDLSVWDVTSQQWMLQNGKYRVMVGKSVEDIQLTTTFSF